MLCRIFELPVFLLLGVGPLGIAIFVLFFVISAAVYAFTSWSVRDEESAGVAVTRARPWRGWILLRIVARMFATLVLLGGSYLFMEPTSHEGQILLGAVMTLPLLLILAWIASTTRRMSWILPVERLLLYLNLGLFLLLSLISLWAACCFRMTKLY